MSMKDPQQTHMDPAPSSNGDDRGQELPLSNPAPSPRWRSLLLGLGLACAVALLGILGWHYWQLAQSRVSTNDAFLSADITQIAPQVSGIVSQVFVQDDQMVKTGDLLAVLDDASYRAACAQAQANLDAAIAQAQAANISVALTAETGDAQLAQAQGVVEQADSGIGSADAQLAGARAGVLRASAARKESEANIGVMNASVEAALAGRERAQAGVQAAQAQVETAQAGVRAAQAGVNAANATADKAARDAERYAALYAKGAVSKQLVEQSTAAAAVTQAQLENARQQVEMAKAGVTAREAELASAREQWHAADAAVTQVKAQLAAAHDRASAVQADYRQAEAQQQVAQQGIHQAEARRTQANGQLQQANTTPRQVALSGSAHTQALAKIEQARAALETARIQLANTRIVAPVSGQISKKTVAVGALVQPGTPLMAVVQRQQLWVIANFKETQLVRMTPGVTAEIAVDALGGHRFHGRVASIAAATGATFALLPPENATGNFTKVVQRIPVKIILDPGQAESDRLRAGMSATATVVFDQRSAASQRMADGN